jgi:hypothetical protein
MRASCLSTVAGPGLMSWLIDGSRRVTDRPEYLAMLWAYFDDSSDEHKQRFCAAGGLLNSDFVWKRFELAWDEAMKDLAGKPFHASDCECGWGDFEGWPKDKRDEIMRAGSSLIRDFDFTAYGCAVSVQDYAEVFPGYGEHDPYLLCIADCIASIAEIAEVSSRSVAPYGLPPTDVQFWIEENKDTAGRATQIFYDLKGIHLWNPSARLSGVTHLGKQIVGLQAADLIAREVFKHFDNKGIRPTRKPVITLANHVTFHPWEKPQLKWMAENGGPHSAVAHAQVASHIMRQPRSAWTPIDIPE